MYIYINLNAKIALRDLKIRTSDCAAEVSDFSILPCEAGEPEAQIRSRSVLNWFMWRTCQPPTLWIEEQAIFWSELIPGIHHPGRSTKDLCDHVIRFKFDSMPKAGVQILWPRQGVCKSTAISSLQQFPVFWSQHAVTKHNFGWWRYEPCIHIAFVAHWEA